VTRVGFPRPRQISPAEQLQSPAGQRLQRLAQILTPGANALQLKADPAGIAPERLLVFDLTADVGNFMRAAAGIPGLEFVGADELEAQDGDRDPALYLMIPDAKALIQMVNLWRTYVAGRPLPYGFAPWRNLFLQMKDLRAWGPEDRLTAEDRTVLAEQQADERGFVRIELELVYRAVALEVQAQATAAVIARGGAIVSSTRIEGARYHAMLADVPLAEIQAILARGYEGIVGSEAVMHIRPQSAVHLTTFETYEGGTGAQAPMPDGAPIAAIFDAVPLALHPQLAGRLSIEDPFGLEAMVSTGVQV
jgi:hypothetical protein